MTSYWPTIALVNSIVNWPAIGIVVCVMNYYLSFVLFDVIYRHIGNIKRFIYLLRSYFSTCMGSLAGLRHIK